MSNTRNTYSFLKEIKNLFVKTKAIIFIFFQIEVFMIQSLCSFGIYSIATKIRKVCQNVTKTFHIRITSQAWITSVSCSLNILLGSTVFPNR